MRIPTTKFQNAFGKYLKHVIENEEVIVTKNGKGVAKLVKYTDPVYTVNESLAEYAVDIYKSYDEFIRITERSTSRYELIDGEIFLLASPTHEHQVAVKEILVQFHIKLKGKKCSPQIAPYDVKLYNDSDCFEDDPNVVQPDIFIMCDPENIDENGRYQGIPSLVVEVLSKSTRSKDMIKKLSLYTLSGISEYWLVDPDNKNILLYVMSERKIDRVDTYKYGDVVHSVLFPEVKVSTENM